jgi:CO/xanthine dehydrogenase FAD-binding subunit
MNVFTPHSMEELQELLYEHPNAKVFAGGTDLFVAKRLGIIDPPSLICLDRIASLQQIADRGHEIFIGACATHSRILHSRLLLEQALVLIMAVRELGSPQIRNMGTIGGNIVTASPAGDTLPPLYVLKAEVEFVSAASSRRMPVDAFIQGPGSTCLVPGEIVTGVAIPKAARWDVVHHEKVGKRKALAIAVAGMSALIRVSKSNRIEEARLAWGSLGPKIVASEAVEKALIGRLLDLATLQDAAELAREAVSPIGDVRATQEYRRTLAGNLLLRLAQYADRKEAKS